MIKEKCILNYNPLLQVKWKSINNKAGVGGKRWTHSMKFLSTIWEEARWCSQIIKRMTQVTTGLPISTDISQNNGATDIRLY